MPPPTMPSEPERVRADAGWVAARARQVHIEPARIEAVAADIAAAGFHPPAWNDRFHYANDSVRTANYILLLDTLNFSFWGEPRWRIEYQGEILNGYWALAAALKRGIEEGMPLWDARYLSTLPAEALARVFRGEGAIPLFPERVALARETGQVLCTRYRGEFARAVRAADGSAAALVDLLVREFPSFRDTATYEGRLVHFDKRAQICVADLFGAFAGQGLGEFRDLAALTAFADYKVPQVLRRLGIIGYADALAAQVDGQVEIAPGSPAEVEIRAGTIWAVELLQRALAARGISAIALQIDWYLWEAGQRPDPDDRPYHRTRTIYY